MINEPMSSVCEGRKKVVTLHPHINLTLKMIPKQMIHFFQLSDEPWGVKDICSRYIYVNPAYFKYLDIPADNTCLLDHSYEVVEALSPLGGKLVEHDKKVILTGQRLEAIGTVNIGNSFRSFIFEKYPFHHKNGVIIGTIFHLKTFERLSMAYFLDKPFYGEAVFIPPTKLFTRREWEVLFLLFRGGNRAQIANFLGLSELSVRNIISRLYLLTSTSSKETLLESGVNQGWHLYVPPRFTSVSYDMLFKDNGT